MAALAATIAVALLHGAVPASARHRITGPTKTYKVSWHLAQPLAQQIGTTLQIWLVSGYCYGEQRPIAGPASVVELPASAGHPRPRTIITAHVIAPAPHETKKERETNFCADLGLSIRTQVELKRPIAGTVFLDGSYDPPRRVQMVGP